MGAFIYLIVSRTLKRLIEKLTLVRLEKLNAKQQNPQS